MLIEINDILPVSVNSAYRTWRGRILISKKGREFKDQVNEIIKQYDKVEGKVKMSITYYFKDKRCRDIDNYQKTLIDCMKNVVIEDDDLIYELNLKKYIGCGYNKIVIHIDKLEEM
jgi:crossover junction endodeoxyribonuclease RusA